VRFFFPVPLACSSRDSSLMECSTSKIKLNELLLKLHDRLQYSHAAEKEDCDEATVSLQEFAAKTLAEKNRRQERPITDVLLEQHIRDVIETEKRKQTSQRSRSSHENNGVIATDAVDALLPTVVSRPGPHERDTLAQTEISHGLLCSRCVKRYSPMVCDGCECSFRWCCAGYEREPCEDPFYNGTCVQLQSYCKECLANKGVSALQILAQEMEFQSLMDLFDSGKCKFRWVPGFSDGFCIFSVTWMALEAFLFQASPFFSGIGMEGGNMDWHGSGTFLQFVAGSAREAQFLALSDDEHTVWRSIEEQPKSCPLYQLKYSIESACQCIVQFLSKTSQTRLSIWEHSPNAEVPLFCSRTFGQEQGCVSINILVWDQSCAHAHYDLLLPSLKVDLMEGDN
jgi:hypothetical protein